MTQAMVSRAGSTPSASAPEPAIRIRMLPPRISLTELSEFAAATATTAGRVVLGIGGDAAEVLDVDLFAGDGRWLIAGPPRSGRTCLLLAILEQVVASECELLVAAPRRSALVAIARSCGVPVSLPDAVPDFAGAPNRRRLVLVDDSELFLDTAVGAALCALAQQPGEGNTAVVVAGRSDELALTYRGLAFEVRRSRTGVLMQPAPGDGDLFGLRLPRARPQPLPGRGLLIADQPQLADLAHGSQAIPIQVALTSSR
jgi:DNA segregation ATPase FtsK/SpoIIIE, S-DNA-T family